MIRQFKNILPENDFNQLYERLITSPKWSFTGKSSGGSDNFNFWYMDLGDDYFFTDELFQIICRCTNLDYEILRVYANGQTYGCPGNLHYDGHMENELTFLYYVNPIWHISWGGQTVFSQNEETNVKTLSEKLFTDSNEIISYHPIPNSGLLFNSNIAHVGLDSTRHYKDLRVTVAYKLRKK